MTAYFLITLPLASGLAALLHLILKRKGRAQHFLFYAGLVHILAGIPLLPTLLIYLGLGSIGAGALLMLLAIFRPAPVISAVLTVLPASVLAFLVWQETPSSNVFLIPENYRGRILIVHGCDDGVAEEYEGMKRVYRIPANGVLKSRFSFAGNSFDHMNSFFYFVNKAGERTKISDTPAGKEVQVQGLWTLPHERSGETIIDFIVEEGIIDDPASYGVDAFTRLQAAIDSCRRE